MLELDLFIENMDANGASELTMKNYRINISKFLSKLNIETFEQLEKVTKADIQKYRITLKEEGLTDSSINTYTAPLISFFKFLYEENYIKNNPTNGIKLKKVKQKPMTFLTEDEAKALIRSCSTKKQKAMFYLMMNTGIRISELVNIEMNDIKDGKLYINKAKRDESRYIPLSRYTTKMIQDYIGRTPMKNLKGEIVYDDNGDIVYTDGERIPPVIPGRCDKNYLFTSRTGNKMERTSIDGQLKRISRKAGISKNISCHKLRSTAATIQAIHGTNVKNIQTILGHKSSEMTMRYIQMVDDCYRREITENGLRM